MTFWDSSDSLGLQDKEYKESKGKKMNVAKEFITTITGRKVFYSHTTSQRNGSPATHWYGKDGMLMGVELPYDRALDMSR